MLKWLVRVVLAMLVLAVAAPPTEARERGGHHTGHRHHHHRGHAFVGIGPWWWGPPYPYWYYPPPYYYWPPRYVIEEPPVYIERQPWPPGYWYYCASAQAYYHKSPRARRRGSRSSRGPNRSAALPQALRRDAQGTIEFARGVFPRDDRGQLHDRIVRVGGAERREERVAELTAGR